MSVSVAGPVVESLPPGNPGIRYSAERMLERAHHAGAYSPLVRLQAERILRDALPSPLAQHPVAEAMQVAAIHEWVREHTIYVRDPLGAEELRGAERMIAEVHRYGTTIGDCDDLNVELAGALLAAIGVPFRVVLVSSRPDREYDHVFLVADTAAGPIPVDPSSGGPLGTAPPVETITAHEILEPFEGRFAVT